MLTISRFTMVTPNFFVFEKYIYHSAPGARVRKRNREAFSDKPPVAVADQRGSKNPEETNAIHSFIIIIHHYYKERM